MAVPLIAAGQEFADRLLAAWDAGEAVVPIDPRLAPAEQAVRREAAAASGDGALVVFTSGTTSRPKPVVLSRGNVEANARGVAAALGLTGDDRWLCPMPLSHVGGLMIPLRAHLCGFAYELTAFDARAVAERLGQGGITIVSLVPTMLARLLDAGLRTPPDLRVAMLGGGPVPPDLAARAVEAGVPVAQTYGLTEACSTVTVARPGDTATAGRPIPGTAVEIAGDGEILVSGPTVAGGGVLRTGDLGSIDEDGRLTLIGRKADTIVSGGENVAPAEVEAALLAHPAVADAGVFGRPDPEWGEAVTAAIVLRPGAAATEQELRDWCGERLARFKVPKQIEFVPTLPRTGSGKLLRRDLR